MRDDVQRAVNLLALGELVVYPTETVYGLGADAIAADAVERVYDLKGRDHDKPLSLAVPGVDAALDHVSPTDREERFMREFLPGPVTVVTERQAHVPDVLTAGGDRVGVRIPDHEIARAILEEFAPVTATSANVSGRPSVTNVESLDDEVRDGVGVVVDGGETAGTESTVVDVEAGEIFRRGTLADDVEAWLADN